MNKNLAFNPFFWVQVSITRLHHSLMKGMREYTKSGYEKASKQFHLKDLDVDCSGVSYMITGANSGIGKQVHSIL